MMARAFAFAALTGVVGGCATTSTRATTAAPTASPERSAQSLVVIDTDYGRGLGFVIDPAGYVVTNRHVIEDADRIESVTLPNLSPAQTFTSVRVAYADPAHDLALLKISGASRLPAVKLAAPRAGVSIGDAITVFRGEEQALPVDRRVDLRPTTGHVKATGVKNPLAGPGSFIELRTPIEEGQSGGPVLDQRGRVVGVVTWTWKGYDGGFAIPVADARAMLRDRPRVDAGNLERRAGERARAYLAALDARAYDTVRAMTSPSRAKAVRERVVQTIVERGTEQGAPALRALMAALEEVATDETIDEEERALRVEDIVARTGSAAFQKGLTVEGELPSHHVLSFFAEFSAAYLLARRHGNADAAGAIDAAFGRVRTVAAARTFLVADSLAALSGDNLAVTDVSVIPGPGGAAATVAVSSAGAPGEASTYLLTLRFEWGDFYVADVRPHPVG